MPEKDPQTWSLTTWLLLIVMILLGGITSWYRRVKEGHARAFNLIELAGEFAISGLVGFTGFVVAQHYFSNDGMAAAAAGISAHFATRLIFSAEGLIEIGAKRLASKIGKI